MWFWSHYSDVAAAHSALQQACQQLQPGGYLLIPLQKSGLWADLFCGPQHPLLSLQSANFWQQQLSGWTVQVLDFANAGLELLIATEEQFAVLALPTTLKQPLGPTLIGELTKVLGADRVRIMGGIAIEKTQEKPRWGGRKEE